MTVEEQPESGEPQRRRLLLDDQTLKLIMCRLDISQQQKERYNQKMAKARHLGETHQEQQGRLQESIEAGFDSLSRLEEGAEGDLLLYHQASRSLLQPHRGQDLTAGVSQGEALFGPQALHPRVGSK